MTDRRTLIFDIETSPNLSWHFGTRNPFIGPDQIKEPTRMISWAGRWTGESRLFFRSEYHHTTEDMLETLWSLLDEADVTVTYNGDRFDHKHVQREFHQAGMSLPSPSVSVDLFKVVKKNELWPSHKLDYISRNLGLEQKLQHSGFLLWREAMGDFGEERQRKAWNVMRRYNKQDVVVTEELLEEYLPLVTMPALELYASDPGDGRPMCPNCGTDHVKKQGFRFTKTRRYQQYQCLECARWFSSTRSDMGVSSA